MPDHFRRLRRRDLTYLLSIGNRSNSKHLSLVYANSVSGCAVVVSKKIAKTSVQRHRLKRQLFAVCRASTLPTKSLVLFARKGAETLTYKDLFEETNTLFNDLMRYNTSTKP
ncbi:MAG: hypothetical protein B7X04_02710 [Parcubacteria group bacterium 21-54-25]|nr:MAG: hypothetical protein B7X04_02710 [Parcubacteria group bacterium 21-54-25]